MPIEIVEILSRSKQGMTKPFLCQADDGYNYYVKGKGAGRKSLISEYVCGSLGKLFGLPIAEFEIVEVSESLISLADDETKSDLGVGMAFASKVTPQLQELAKLQVDKVDIQLRRDLLVFDWWIQNADRTLTELGGNPNLLWDSVNKRLHVIDHNQAFDREFKALDFCHTHVFSSEIVNVFDDMIEQTNYYDRLSVVFGSLDAVCDNVPPSWWWVDDGVPADLNVSDIRQTLARFSANNFWRIV